MAGRMLECPVCTNTYNQTTHQPRLLACSHTYCLACLTALFAKSGRIECPEDRSLDYTALEKLPVNRVLIDLLGSISIRCEDHNKAAFSFCFTHYTPVCDQCKHPGCQVVDAVEEAEKVKFQLIGKINETAERLRRENVALPQTLEMSVRNVYTNTLRDNVNVVQKLKELVESRNQLTCRGCHGRQNLTLYQQSLEVLCSTCMTPGGMDGKSYPVTDEASARRALDECIRNLMGQINFCDLNLDVLHRWTQRGNQPPTAVLDLARVLIGYREEKKGTDQLPRSFCCVQCLQQLELVSARIRVLPCKKALHAICEGCADALRNQGGFVCPLDGFNYKVAIDSLPLFFVQKPTSPIKPGNAQYKPQPIPPRPNKDPEYPGSDLPPFELIQGRFVLDRFPSVLPASGTPESQLTRDNRGWGINANANQVEAMTFLCSEKVKLIGLGIANPFKPDVTATLQFIKIYAGTLARGNPTFAQTPNLQLSGGNSILTYYNFPTPCPVNPNVFYCLKLKIVPSAGGREIIMYRGNSFERPDIWAGSDYAVWDFDEVQNAQLEAGEVTGQNNLTGPILRFIYTH